MKKQPYLGRSAISMYQLEPRLLLDAALLVPAVDAVMAENPSQDNPLAVNIDNDKPKENVSDQQSETVEQTESGCDNTVQAAVRQNSTVVIHPDQLTDSIIAAAKVKSLPENGNLIMLDDGSIQYMPDANYNGSDMFVLDVETPAGHSEYIIEVDVQSYINADNQLILDGLQQNQQAFSEVIFIDKNIQNYQDFISEINSDGLVFTIDSQEDGVLQIASMLESLQQLQQFKPLDAIHIISHGDVGQLKLGNSTLSLASIEGEHAQALAVFKNSLSSSADILIYGCNFGQGEVGRNAVDALAKATGADIAASDDNTGNTFNKTFTINLFNGTVTESNYADWDFEVKTGSIETASYAPAAWQGVLALFELTPASAPTLIGAVTVNLGGENRSVLDSIGDKAIWSNVLTEDGDRLDIVAEILSLTPMAGNAYAETLTEDGEFRVRLWGSEVNSAPTLEIDWQLYKPGTVNLTTGLASLNNRQEGEIGFTIQDIDGTADPSPLDPEAGGLPSIRHEFVRIEVTQVEAIESAEVRNIVMLDPDRGYAPVDLTTSWLYLTSYSESEPSDNPGNAATIYLEAADSWQIIYGYTSGYDARNGVNFDHVANGSFDLGGADGSGVLYNIGSGPTVESGPIIYPTDDSFTLNDISYTDGANSGNTVQEIAISQGGNIGVSGIYYSAEPLVEPGIAIIETNSAQIGEWEFSTDNGFTWQQIGSVSENSALLLSARDKIRFNPSGTAGGNPTLSFAAWQEVERMRGLNGTFADVKGDNFSISRGLVSISVTGPASNGLDIAIANMIADQCNHEFNYSELYDISAQEMYYEGDKTEVNEIYEMVVGSDKPKTLISFLKQSQRSNNNLHHELVKSNYIPDQTEGAEVGCSTSGDNDGLSNSNSSNRPAANPPSSTSPAIPEQSNLEPEMSNQPSDLQLGQLFLEEQNIDESWYLVTTNNSQSSLQKLSFAEQLKNYKRYL